MLFPKFFPPRRVGGTSLWPPSTRRLSFLPSLGCDAQSLHHAHDQPGPMLRNRGGVFSLDPFLQLAPCAGPAPNELGAPHSRFPVEALVGAPLVIGPPTRSNDEGRVHDRAKFVILPRDAARASAR